MLSSIAYIGLMIYFRVSNKPKLKIIGKIMLGSLIGLIVIAILFFLTCGAIFVGAFK